MSLWMVRGAGRGGEFQNLALEKGIALIGFHQVADLSRATTKEAVYELCREGYPEASEAKLRNVMGQLFAFARRIEKGDLIVMPLKSRPQIAVGQVSGAYVCRKDVGELHHSRPVDWLRDDIPRSAIGQDLLQSLGAFMTVCQIKRNNAEARFKALLERKKDPGSQEEPTDTEFAEEQVPTDIEQLARDQILAHLQKNFKGHKLADLVDAVLRAEGYRTKVSPPGPDGGVDILAGRGALGFDDPKLCVQVKSSESPIDVTALRALQGTMQNFKAEKGLFVSWGGYKSSVEKEGKLSFFSVRLWDANELVDALFRNYDRLPEEIQKELPLKRVWTLVLEE